MEYIIKYSVCFCYYCNATLLPLTTKPLNIHSMKKREPKNYASKQGCIGKCSTIQLGGRKGRWQRKAREGGSP